MKQGGGAADEGQRGEGGQCVRVQEEEEEAGRGVGMRGSLRPRRRDCNLGHTSHKACWVIHLS